MRKLFWEDFLRTNSPNLTRSAVHDRVIPIYSGFVVHLFISPQSSSPYSYYRLCPNSSTSPLPPSPPNGFNYLRITNRNRALTSCVLPLSSFSLPPHSHIFPEASLVLAWLCCRHLITASPRSSRSRAKTSTNLPSRKRKSRAPPLG